MSQREREDSVYMDAPSPSAHPPQSEDADDQFIEYADEPEYAAQGDTEFVEYADEQPPTSPRPQSSDALKSSASDEKFSHSDSMKSLERVNSRRSAYRSSNLFSKEDDPQMSIPTTEEEGPLGRAREGDQVDLNHTNQLPTKTLVETLIEWNEGGNSVYVTGSFTGWKQMIPLRKMDDSSFMVVLKLAPGTHRLRFVVDGELRCSNSMNSATDSMGNLVNYMEVYNEPSVEENDIEDDIEAEYNYSHEYTQEIPEIFADPEAFDQYSSIEFAPPPQLPPHLDGVILNSNNTEKDNNSVLPIPNHVVLNHLATTSIKHNVLAVASVSRYHAKYVTQILYTPIEGV